MPDRRRLDTLVGVMANLGWAFFCMDEHTALFFFKRLLLG